MPNEGGFAGHPKNASAFFGDPGPAPTRTTSVVPFRGLGLGYGFLIYDGPAFAGEGLRHEAPAAILIDVDAHDLLEGAFRLKPKVARAACVNALRPALHNARYQRIGFAP